MNHLKLSLLFLCIITLGLVRITPCFAQRVYFGFPVDTSKIRVGDVIIINTPPHQSGKFYNSEELESLVSFIDSLNYEIDIYVNEFLLPDDRNNFFSEIVCKRLNELLENRIKQKKFTVYSSAKQVPLYSDVFVSKFFPLASDVTYQIINSRIEIHIRKRYHDSMNVD